MLGNQLVNVFVNSFCQFFRIRSKLLQDLGQHRVIDLLVNTEISGITVHKAGQLHHHIGQDLHLAFFRLNIHKRNGCILNLIRQRCIHLISCGSQHLSRSGIHHVGSQHLMTDSVP